MDKKAIRQNILAILNSLSDEYIRRESLEIYQKVIENEKFRKAASISIFLSMNKEVQTDDLVKKIFDDGKSCFVPRFAKNDMFMVKLKDYQDFQNLPRSNKYGIRQPDLHEKRDDAFDTDGLDLILAPGVAFTKDGRRLGHGKGYYDGFLNKYTEKFPLKKPYVLGLGFKEQILDFVPTTDHDFVLNEVISN